MLVLRRRKGESLVIDGGRILVTVLEIEGNVIKIGVEAHPSITVVRDELLRKETKNDTK